MQRVKLDPSLRKLLHLGLIGFGAVTVMSAVVNAVGAWQLIDAAEEQSLGITRSEFLVTYASVALVGVALICGGWRLRRP